jgi:hypothetical protein
VSLSDHLQAAAPAPAATPAPTPIRRGVNVVVEPTDDGRFWVMRVREGASAGVLYTRDELVELRARIGSALEVG